MEVIKKWVTVLLFCIVLTDSCGLLAYTEKKNPIGDFISAVGCEIAGIHKYLFDWDTLKILALTFPLFVGARMIDEKLQRCFYDFHTHKNKHNAPRWCHDIAEFSVAIPIIFCALEAVLARDDEFREACRTYFVGMPFVISGKDLIKSLEFDSCLRPWNGKFGCECRSSGGFPSGHLAEATYAAVIFGLRYGPVCAIPLGGLAVAIGATFIVCNRHYSSQLIAGAALGAMYGIAAHKFIDEKMRLKYQMSVSVNEYGGPNFNFSYHF
jgi:membrane-associated phospholipid phosphatase